MLIPISAHQKRKRHPVFPNWRSACKYPHLHLINILQIAIWIGKQNLFHTNPPGTPKKTLDAGTCVEIQFVDTPSEVHKECCTIALDYVGDGEGSSDGS